MIDLPGKWDWLFDELKGFKAVSHLPLILKFLKGRIKGPDDITKCTLCPNMCRHACPVGIVDGSETTSPSGKSRIDFLIENKELSKTLEDCFPLYMCLSCGCCEPWCPFDFSVADILHPLKEKLVAEGIVFDAFKQVFHNLETYGYVYGEPKHGLSFENNAGEVVYLQGCGFREHYPEVPKKAINIIKKFGKQVDVLANEQCCGLPAYALGNTVLFKKIAQDNMKTLNASNARFLVTSCPSCAYAYKVLYPKFGCELRPQVFHILEFFNENTQKGMFTAKQPCTVTFHDPCKLVHGLHQPNALEHFLQHIQNLSVQSPRRHGSTTFCCGYGGSSIHRLSPKLADEIATERLTELSECAPTIVTACPSCKQSFETNKKPGVTIVDVVELLDSVT